jgi:sulfite reductase alpha subunit-like flavoprotein
LLPYLTTGQAPAPDSDAWQAKAVSCGTTFCNASPAPVPVQSEEAAVCHSDVDKDAPPSSAMEIITSANSKLTYSWQNPFFAPVTEIRQLTAPEHQMRQAKHFTFDLSSAPAGTMNYETGDYLGIIPSNLRAVDSVIRLLDWKADEQLNRADFSEIPRLPPTFSVREALTHYFDIRNPPKRSVIRTLAEFATNPFERRTLMHLGTSSDSAESPDFYQEYILRDNRGIATILRDFPSIRIAPLTLLNRLSPQKPRLYSIANSGADSGVRASMCMTILFGPAPDGRPWYGTNSYFMDKAALGDRIPMFIQPSSIRPPSDPQVPLIMVGVGTGISLLRSLWQHRTAQPSGPNLLFYGCNSHTDDLYRDELDQLSNRVETFRSHTFDPIEPTFVQYRFTENGRRIVDMILYERAHIYVCGHKALGTAIGGTLRKLLRRWGAMHYHEAGEYLNTLRQENRYVEEIFQ